MAVDPRMLAAVMQRMQPMPGMNQPVPPAPPPPGKMPQPADAQAPGMPVQMQGTMLMKPAQPQDGSLPGFNRTAPGGAAPPRQF
jgi:hypothetical protein